MLYKDLIKLSETLENINSINCKAIMGLDGFVDQILHAVETREDADNYTRMRTLQDFGEKIYKAAGLSTSVEFVPITEKLGGNGPIMSNALATYGMDITYIGALGTPTVHPVFNNMPKKCNLISIANPGLTDAVEFLDGKLIIGKRQALKSVNWNKLKETVGCNNLISLFNESKLIGLENWTMLPYMTDIWKGLLKEIVPYVNDDSERFIFFDLADPENRLKTDIQEALSIIKEFSSKFKVILGLNLKESTEVCHALDLDDTLANNSLEELTKALSNKIDIYCLVVHPVKKAACVCNGEFYHTYGPYEPKPKLTTGAGDNFNAGFCLGQVLGLSPKDSLILGTATSGYYVRNAKSPNLNDIKYFIKQWNNNL